MQNNVWLKEIKREVSTNEEAKINILTVKEKTDELTIIIQNKNLKLVDVVNDEIEIETVWMTLQFVQPQNQH